jgi:hypothetical protein
MIYSLCARLNFGVAVAFVVSSAISTSVWCESKGSECALVDGKDTLTLPGTLLVRLAFTPNTPRSENVRMSISVRNWVFLVLVVWEG